MKRLLLSFALVLTMCTPTYSGFTGGQNYYNLNPYGDWYFLPPGAAPGAWEYQEYYGDFSISFDANGNFVFGNDVTVWIYDFENDEWSLLFNDNPNSPGGNESASEPFFDYPFSGIFFLDGGYFLAGD
jgi:hypothetical protein